MTQDTNPEAATRPEGTSVELETQKPASPVFDMARLRSLTAARIALGQVGPSIPTRSEQTFLLDHAKARAAVWSPVDWKPLIRQLDAADLPSLHITSAAPDRTLHIRRPDLGRKLSDTSRDLLQGIPPAPKDALILIGDGLSATAVQFNAAPLAEMLAEKLSSKGLSLAPVMLAENARVALGDEVASLLDAEVVITLIGERPGLSAADSLGAYITYAPRPGTPDSRRNCISNIREGGLSLERASDMIVTLIEKMRRAKTSGVTLEDTLNSLLESPQTQIAGQKETG